MDNRKIVIIGGGIGGLTAAIALNRKGLSPLIYEKAGSFDEIGAGLALWPNAASVLDKLGLLQKLLKYSNNLTEMRTTNHKGSPINTVRLKKLEDKFHFPSIVIRRMDLQKELLKAIPPSLIIYNKQFTKLESNGNNVNLYFSDGKFETADCVIFADGVHSLARKNIFNLPPLKYAGRTSWRGIAQFEKPFFADNAGYEILGKGSRFGIFPLPGNSAYWYAAVNMPEDTALQQNRTRECVLSHFKNWAEPLKTLIENTPEEKLILTNIKFSFDINKLVSGNTALLGDAAHPMTPDLGQGACQAIEDANIIAECLSENGTIEENLKSYEKKRLMRVRSIARNSYRIGKLRQMENPISLAIRNTLFKILPEALAIKMIARNIIVEK